jgi:hypothetical protein
VGPRGRSAVTPQVRFLKRQLSLPVSRMSQWWVRRSSSAVVILASAKTLGHSAKGEVGRQHDRGAFVKPADQVEQHLPAADRERQIAELIENDEIGADQLVGEFTGRAGPRSGLELVDAVDDDVEAAARTAANAGSRDGHGEMRLAGAGRGRDRAGTR